MYTSGRNVKSRAAKPAGLTISKATADARRLAVRHLPAELVTIESRLSYDLNADQKLIVTVLTFPAKVSSLALWRATEALSAVEGRVWSACRIEITRAA